MLNSDSNNNRYTGNMHLFSQKPSQNEGVSREFAFGLQSQVDGLLEKARKGLSLKPTNEDSLRAVETLSRCVAKIKAYIDSAPAKESQEEHAQSYSSNGL
jgi:hypothetical protein